MDSNSQGAPDRRERVALVDGVYRHHWTRIKAPDRVGRCERQWHLLGASPRDPGHAV